jgi:threonine aldolase
MHGGDMYQNWPYATVALHFLDGFADRFAQARAKADSLFETLEATGRFEIHPIPNGSNIFRLDIGDVNIEQFRQKLREEGTLSVGDAQDDGFIRLHVNETQLQVSNERLAEAFEEAHRAAS